MTTGTKANITDLSADFLSPMSRQDFCRNLNVFVASDRLYYARPQTVTFHLVRKLVRKLNCSNYSFRFNSVGLRVIKLLESVMKTNGLTSVGLTTASSY